MYPANAHWVDCEQEDYADQPSGSMFRIRFHSTTTACRSIVPSPTLLDLSGS